MSAEQGQLLTDRAAAAFTDYRAGQVWRMDELVDILTPVMWHVARACRLDAAASEDVVQTVWLKVVEKAESIKDPQAIVAWVMTATRREAWRVAKRADTTRPSELTTTMDLGKDEPLGMAPPPDPLESAINGDRAQVLWSHFSQLTPRCQELLRMVCFADRPHYEQVAKDLGMPMGSIGPTRGRCLTTLRSALSKDPHWSVCDE
ncbi:RNA polymerase sigma factor [Ornithinimicrobium sp. Arc0846-15]|uniref:RNA polymerase sigma factor n=1 Tax=Ornithinimicrobium sp. INDO-MA30-4 TaxID=2908651 RepID=UPI001C67CC27|nr:sigma-70 family RNA polymerase sigma factor [Ornithinimicrobium sp. INDO-MA30-4]MBW8173899.1 RNA polymerase sigma factor [Ornithinimicrobium laminariae]UJH70222.1 RNA polymerase sigma factor [Ornithinimicrobium sp. INDO-MA30-4]